MSPGQPQQQPLLVSRTASHDDQRLDEEDALLTDQHTSSAPTTSTTTPRHSRWRELGLFLWAFSATAVIIVLAVLLQHRSSTPARHDSRTPPSPPSPKRNLIFMVSDGMGPSSLSLTRSFRQHVHHLPWSDALALDPLLVGQSRTRSSDSWVTDSAAGATAFACGAKSYNGAISVLPPGEEGEGARAALPCGSVMEAAKRAGYRTGLVVTTRVTDATPATFVTHVRRREMEDEIARQMVGERHPLGRMVDLVMGGGRCQFLGNGTRGSCRGDGVDVVGWAEREAGWKYVETREGFDGLATGEGTLPLLALLAHEDIPFEIDRRHQEGEFPSLEEMTRKALGILEAATRDSEKGFFVMIEGSRIDHAGHFNDPAAQVHEVLAYDRAMTAVMEFIGNSSTPTLMVATSDHETGGLAVARQVQPEYPDYLWYPAVLANASHSATYASHEYHEYLRKLFVDESPSALELETMKPVLKTYLTALASKTLGIRDVTAKEMGLLISYSEIALYVFADMISRRAQIGWSTHGHTAADVNIYTSDPHAAAALRGNRENTEVGAFLRSYLDLDDDVKEVTKELREHMRDDKKSDSWLGSAHLKETYLVSQDPQSYYMGNIHVGAQFEKIGF